MKIYLAGPDIFRPDAHLWAESARELCHRFGFKPLLPLDHNETTPGGIFKANIELIKKAQIVVANLDPFRGPEPDSGTAFELGYAYALGKKICGYVTRMDSTVARVKQAEGKKAKALDSRFVDSQDRVVEDFGHPVNLMISVPTQIVEGGLEACLQMLKTRPGTAS